MTTQVSAGSVTDAKFLYEGWVVQAALLQVAHGFWMAVELELIEGGRLLQQSGKSGRRGLTAPSSHTTVRTWRIRRFLRLVQRREPPRPGFC